MSTRERRVTDPVERIVAEALEGARIPFVHETQGTSIGLDFDLPTLGVKIECKQFHTDRTATQLARNPNVILIQGMQAARAFAALLAGAIHAET